MEKGKLYAALPHDLGSRPIRRWTEDEDLRLQTMIKGGFKVPAIATALGRTKSSTVARKAKLGLSLRTPEGSRCE